MKKAILLLFVLTLFSALSLHAQNTPLRKCEIQINVLTSQRDSLGALYLLVLSRLDSVVGDYLEQEKQIKKMDVQITQLKTEINNTLKKKNDAADGLARAKKLIADQNILIQKLEAEIKRLSQKQ